MTTTSPPPDVEPLPQHASPARHLAVRVRRHAAWLREEGLARLVEENDLDPRRRVGAAVRKARWRAANPVAPGTARLVLVLGLQRSGTNMVVRGFEEAGEVEVRNENDPALFARYELLDDDVVARVVRDSRHAVVLAKPLCDSHRANDLLDGLALDTPPRAVWAHRDVDGRARSAVAKFGDVNRRVLVAMAAGRDLDRWQAGGLDDDDLELVRSFDPAGMTPHAAAALFWLLRNRLYFTLGLDRRDDVLAVSYGRVVADPATETTRLAAHVGVPYRPRLHAHVDDRAAVRRRAPLELGDRLRELCDELEAALDVASRHEPVPPDTP